MLLDEDEIGSGDLVGSNQSFLFIFICDFVIQVFVDRVVTPMQNFCF